MRQDKTRQGKIRQRQDIRKITQQKGTHHNTIQYQKAYDKLHDKTRQEMARQDKTRQDKTRDRTGQGKKKTAYDEIRQDMTGHDKTT